MKIGECPLENHRFSLQKAIGFLWETARFGLKRPLRHRRRHTHRGAEVPRFKRLKTWIFNAFRLEVRLKLHVFHRLPCAFPGVSCSLQAHGRLHFWKFWLNYVDVVVTVVSLMEALRRRKTCRNSAKKIKKKEETRLSSGHFLRC